MPHRPAAWRAGPGTAAVSGSCAGLRALVGEHVTLLVLLPAPARAGIVAPDARPGPHRHDARRLLLLRLRRAAAVAPARRRRPGCCSKCTSGLGVLRHQLARARAALDLLHRLGGELHAE